MTLVIAVVAGLLIGLALGTLGGGGSILAVPVFVYLLDQTAAQGTTGSLVVVGLTSLVGALTAWRNGTVLLPRGITFGLAATGGAAIGALASSRVPDAVLLGAFSALLITVAGVMVVRLVNTRRADGGGSADEGVAGTPRRSPGLDDPIISFSPTFVCRCPRALKVLLTATVVGLLTGFLGVGGGFLVVPALVLALSLPIHFAAGTSLVVITVTSATALAVRTGTGPSPDWALVAVLTAASVVGGWAGSRGAARISAVRLHSAFTGLLVAVGLYTASRAFPAMA